MADDRLLADALTACIDKENIRYTIETGTYVGLGSTQMIAEVFLRSGHPELFVTIEANWSSWIKARKNLAKYDFVTAVWGKSVAEEEAVRFIEEDPVLQQHREYPDVWIDDVEDPRKFYINEIQGRLGGGSSPIDRCIRMCAKPFFYSGDDLLRKYLFRFRHLKPLVVLDSAGGTGYLEFSILLTLMDDKPYLVLLDDIHHLKHFRSLREIESNSGFTILASSKENGWLLAKHE